MMGRVNAAIEVGMQQLVVQMCSGGERFCESNELRAIKRITERLLQNRLEEGVIEVVTKAS